MNTKIILTILLIVLVSTVITCSSTPSPVKVVGGPYYSMTTSNRGLTFEVEPTDETISNRTYKIELYEKGIKEVRETVSIVWNQSEVNVKTVRYIHFTLTKEEGRAYNTSGSNAKLSKIFYIKLDRDYMTRSEREKLIEKQSR